VKNENIVTWLDGEPDAISPNFIAKLDRKPWRERPTTCTETSRRTGTAAPVCGELEFIA
jgi:hypothetical protein